MFMLWFAAHRAAPEVFLPRGSGFPRRDFYRELSFSEAAVVIVEFRLLYYFPLEHLS